MYSDKADVWGCKKEEEMSWKRILKGKVSFHYCQWQRWNTMSVEKFWFGRLIYFNLSKFGLHIDCRINWIEDMTTGIPR